jgi:DNA-binding CsgD family transcriptional regulator
MPSTSSSPVLLGRRNETDRLSSLVATTKAGRGQVLVLRGEPGIGKTALLRVLLERAAGCRITRAAGVEAEMDLAFASLHQLCAPFASRIASLPATHRQALEAAFGLRSGRAPEQSLVSSGVLSLFSAVAEDRPLICIIDDAQWLDRTSSETLESVARRLAAERVAIVFAVREPAEQPRLVGLPEIIVESLGPRDAEALLQSTFASPLDHRVRDRILAECHGNPLALLELPKRLSKAQLAFGGDTAVGTRPFVSHIEQRFLRTVLPLPQAARQLVLAAAAEPVGDADLLWRAAQYLGIAADAVAAGEDSGVVQLGQRIRFRDPLIRAVVYQSATHAERRKVHGALAEATDPSTDPDRRAWHRACAALGPDETIAAELERAAGHARSHGGLAASAAFLERSVTLTPHPPHRTRRSIRAAEAKMAAGEFADASALLSAAELGPSDELERAKIELLHARLSFAADRGNQALPLLLAAGRRLESLDSDIARDAYLDALSAAMFAGRMAIGPDASHVASAVRQARLPVTPSRRDQLLEGLAMLYTEGYVEAARLLHHAVDALVHDEPTGDEDLRSAWLAAATAACLWDDASWDILTRRHLDRTRASGASSTLPSALTARVFVHLFTGDLGAAESLVEASRAVADTTGRRHAPYGEVGLLALRGDPQLAEPAITQCLDDAAGRGEGLGMEVALWARALLCNGLGRYHDALRAAQVAAAEPVGFGPSTWAVCELIEAAARSGDDQVARDAYEQLAAWASASGSEWALGLQAGRRALLLNGRAAEDCYREAIDRLAATTVHVELARARLLYGEWLRRQNRRLDARTQLRSAYETLGAMGAKAFAQRAHHELQATGETVRKRSVATAAELTAQETHIASLATQGLSNAEMGAALHISTRTVEWHLRKIFIKLGISTRRELRRALPTVASTAGAG